MTIRYGHADTPLGRLSYAEAGRGPAVILLQPAPQSPGEFRELILLLAGAHRVVAMDLDDVGRTAGAAGPQRIEEYAAAVTALADALGIHRFSVLGHQTGAVVTVEVAAAVPGRVAAAVLSSPAYTDATYRTEQADRPGADRPGARLACARYVMEDRVELVTAPVLILGAPADSFAFDVEPMAAALVSAKSVEVRIIPAGTVGWAVRDFLAF